MFYKHELSRQEAALLAILNALKRLDHFETLSDDCHLYVEGEDGAFRELMAHSTDVTNAEADVLLSLGHLRELFARNPGQTWSEVWERFDALTIKPEDKNHE